MGAQCKNVIVHCIDFRLMWSVVNFMQEHGFINDTDEVSFAGGAKDIAEGNTTILDQIDLSHKLHNTKKVVLMNHTDCGAYGGRTAFESDEAEKTKHVEDMTKAKDIIQKKIPGIEVKMVLARITEGHHVEFEEIGEAVASVA
jgi:carbonic anhydrase